MATIWDTTPTAAQQEQAQRAALDALTAIPLHADRDGFSYSKSQHWSGAFEWRAFDHVLGADVEHARTKGEGEQRAKRQRRGILAEQTPEYRARVREILAAHRARLDAEAAR